MLTNDCKDIAGVYKLTTGSGSTYIGAAVNMRIRCRHHFGDLVRAKHTNSRLYRSFIKHGGILKAEMILVCRPEDRNFYEQLCIDQFKPNLNLMKIVDGVLQHSEESKAKIGIKAIGNDYAKVTKGYRQSPEACEKKRQALMGNKNGCLKPGEIRTNSLKGTKQPPEVVAKRAQAMMGNQNGRAPRKQTHYPKMSAAQIGNRKGSFPRSKEFCQLMKKVNHEQRELRIAKFQATQDSS